jgi:hypothetical protein
MGTPFAGNFARCDILLMRLISFKKVPEVVRTLFGNIAFAGTDASSNAMTESAIEEAHRSVRSLISISPPG